MDGNNFPGYSFSPLVSCVLYECTRRKWKYCIRIGLDWVDSGQWRENKDVRRLKVISITGNLTRKACDFLLPVEAQAQAGRRPAVWSSRISELMKSGSRQNGGCRGTTFKSSPHPGLQTSGEAGGRGIRRCKMRDILTLRATAVTTTWRSPSLGKVLELPVLSTCWLGFLLLALPLHLPHADGLYLC